MDDFLNIIFKPLAQSIKELDALSIRQREKWPIEYQKAGKTPAESYKPVKESEPEDE